MQKNTTFQSVLSAHYGYHQRGLVKLVPLLLAALLVLVLLLGVRSSMLMTSSAERVGQSTANAGSEVARSNQDDGNSAQQAVVRQRLAALGFEDVSLSPGHTAGWYAASTHQGLYYMDVDGEFLIAGQWFSVINPDAVVNLTEQTIASMRRSQLAEQQSSAIIYGDPDAKYQVSVFTDHTCGYCRRMHQVLDEYLAADMTIHYYAFPRAGMQSQGAAQLAAIWCADDAQAALNRAKLSGDTDGLAEPTDACTAKVAEHLQMGRALGVQGTPALVLPDGRLLTGFRSAEAVLAEIEQNL